MMAAEKSRESALGKHAVLRVTVRVSACAHVPILTLSYVPEVLLTNTGVDLSLTDKDGNTALHLACSSVSGHFYYFNC